MMSPCVVLHFIWLHFNYTIDNGKKKKKKNLHEYKHVLLHSPYFKKNSKFVFLCKKKRS